AALPSGLDSRSIAIDRSLSAPRMKCENSSSDPDGCPFQFAECLKPCDAGPADQRDTCVKDCGDARIECLSACTRIPLSAFVVNRLPSALIIGEVTTPNPTGSTEYLAFYDAITLAPGPSRAVVGKIKNRSGLFETRIFVICFDARIIFIFDPD